MMTLPPLRGIMTSQKVSLPLKREAELLTLYKDLHTRRKVSLLYLEKGQLLDLFIMADKIIGGCVRTSFAGTTEPELYLG